MRRFAISTFLSLALGAGIVHAQCAATRADREFTERAQFRLDPPAPPAAMNAKRAAIFDEGLAKYPGDIFLLRNRMSSEPDHEAEIRWATALREKHPGDPAYAILYALSLEGKNTPEAIRMLEVIQSAHLDSAQVYLSLASVFSSGKFKDKPRAQQEIDGFLKICPAPLSNAALSSISQSGTKEQIAQTAAAVRKQLELETDPTLRTVWQELWPMEFKSHPPTEHDAVRKQIALDLARFEQSPERHKLEWMLFLRTGYGDLGDTASVEKLNDEMISVFPASQDAKRIVQDRWQKAHPYPVGADASQKEAHNRVTLAVSDEWIKRWPGDSMFLQQKFYALSQLPETTPEQIRNAADQFLPAYRKNPYWSALPPIEFGLADAFLKYKIHIDQVPGLVNDGLTAARKRNDQIMADDRNEDQMRDMLSNSNSSVELERARIMLDYAAATKQPEIARAIETDLDAIDASKPFAKSALLQRRAQAAEVEGRKLDALLLYRDALTARTAPPQPGVQDTLKENVERLWKELGGTSEAYALLLDKPKPTTATESSWEQPKNPIPSFSATDLEGKTWKLTSFQGQAVLVNVWATWCGPCKMEHPEFQKLYDKLKDRADVAVISFNVDDDLGKVAPYMKENKYTFPVILGHDIVDAVVPSLAIPRNWFITPHGKLEWEQVGFGPDLKWQEMIMAKLNEVLKENH
jgi:thiol-disulfide isomerase/thioredoxin